MKIALYAFSFLWLVACGAQSEQPTVTAVQPQDNVASDDQEIIKGKEDQGDPAIVALYAKVPGAEYGSLCTSEVISPTVVLTAAHCVKPSLVGEGAEFSVLTAWNLLDKDNPSPRLKVKEVHWHKDFDEKNLLAGHDIAVAILAEPTDITPIPFNRQSIASDWVGNEVRIVGYGLPEHFSQEGAGVKREAKTKLKSVTAEHVKTGTLFGAGICSGDSGGPVLYKINGVETIIGVNSFGFIYCIGASNSTRVDAYLDFVDQYL